MYREKHFTDYARKVAEADAGMKTGDTGGAELPAQPDLAALRQASAANRAPERPASGEWIDGDSPYLDPERRNRDYGGYRPAIGEFADPAKHDEAAPANPAGEAAKP